MPRRYLSDGELAPPTPLPSPRQRRLAIGAISIVGLACFLLWAVTAIRGKLQNGHLGTQDQVVARLNHAGYYQFWDRPEEYKVNQRKATRMAYVRNASQPGDCIVLVYAYLNSAEVCLVTAEGSRPSNLGSIFGDKAKDFRTTCNDAAEARYGAITAMRAVLRCGDVLHLPFDDPARWTAVTGSEGVSATTIRGVDVECRESDSWQKAARNFELLAFATAE